MKTSQRTESIWSWRIGIRPSSIFFSIVKPLMVTMFFLFVLFANNAFAQQKKIIGYLPTWANFPNIINTLELNKLTHINIAFANPTNSGGISGPSNSSVTTVVNKAHSQNVKVFMSFGGAGASKSAYQAVLGNTTSMNNFVTTLVNYTVNLNLDGLDIDIEGDVLDGNTLTASQYQNFIVKLGTELRARNKQMTAALAGWFANQVTNTAAAQFDWINIMSYDAAGSWSGPGQHSPYSLAVNDFNFWKNSKGVPASKLVIGVPFYGYGWGSYGNGTYIDYSKILNTYGGSANSDQVGSGNNVIYYNGIPTIKSKANFALQQNTGGIMIWELSQDVAGTRSLLNAIYEVLGTTTPPVPQGPFNSVRMTLPGKIEAENYDVGGAGVAYNDGTAGNEGTVYRSEDVDVQASTDTGAGYNLGWTTDGEWLEYSINITAAGTYNFDFRTASTTGGAIRLELDGADITGTVALPNTGGWQTWATTSKANVNLPAGQHLLRVFVVTGGFNLNYVSATAVPTCVPVKASSDDGNIAANALDNNLATRWSADGDGQWLQFCQASPQTINGIQIAFYNGNVRRSIFDVEVSNDGLAWTKVLTNVQSSGSSLALESFSFATQSVKYIRILGHGNTVNTWNSYTEVKLGAAPVNQLPTVSLTSPVNNSSLIAPAGITITANATDADGTISKVEFFNGTTKLGEDATAPYSYSWTNVVAGTYIITAKATDNSNAATTSSAVTVTVTNPVADCPNLTWSDEFNGTSLDLSKWNYQTGDGCPGICGWGNNELEYYTNSTNNVSVSGGNLAITARYENNYNGTGRNYTSGKLVTSGKFSQKYGRYEARIKVPSAAGIWPAFWMLADNTSWPSTGEIDILECANANPTKWLGTLHYASTTGAHQSQGAVWNAPTPISNDFHVYACEWTTDKISWYIDGVLRGTVTKATVAANGGAWPFDNQKFYIILNLAVGGNFAGQSPIASQYPQTMLVDYVKVYSGDPCNVVQSPYGGTASLIPGTIQAENYDLGGQGVAFNDSETANQGGVYRTDAVDIQATTDNDGGYNVGWTTNGEWLEYTVNVANAGAYDIALRTASTSGGAIRLEMDGVDITGTMTLPNTGAWQTWATTTKDNVALTAGQHILRVFTVTGAFNLNYVRFTNSSTTPPVNQLPSVSITAPANNSSTTAPASLAITANASDVDGTISKVEFFNGSTKLGEDLTAPYSYTWSNVGAGSYSITAKATDNLGAAKTSAAVTVTVTNPVSTNKCSGIAQYAENNGYVAGSKVQSGGKLYQCRPYPYSGWCNGSAWAYAPGTGSYWADAWTDQGTCSSSLRSAENENTVGVWNVFPNPATSVLNISSPSGAESAQVSVMDVLGMEVLSISNWNAETVDVSSLSTGVYTLIIQTDGTKISKTFVKQ